MTDNTFLPKKSMGQHWLNDNEVLEAMCASANIKPSDRVLEIGPGTGELTAILLKHQVKVIALEYDSELIPGLKKRFKTINANQLTLIEGDIRTYNFNNLNGSDYKIVANIPYYLTANLLRRLTDDINNKPAVIAILVQKEVAERVAAKPGRMSILAVAAQFYYKVSLGRVVEASLFIPPPKVDSQILILRLNQKPLYPNIDSDLYFRIVKAGFSQRRKTLSNTLSSGLHLSKMETEEILLQTNIHPQTRAQSLSLDNWATLYKAIALKLSK